MYIGSECMDAKKKPVQVFQIKFCLFIYLKNNVNIYEKKKKIMYKYMHRSTKKVHIFL